MERLAPGALSAVPEAMVRAMREATTAADIDRLRELFTDVEREAGAPVASALRALADGFDLAGLHRALAADGPLAPTVEALATTSGGAM